MSEDPRTTAETRPGREVLFGSRLEASAFPKGLALGVIAASLLLTALAAWSPAALTKGLRAVVELRGGVTVLHGVVEWTTVLLALTVGLFALARLSVLRDSVTKVIANVVLFSLPFDILHLGVAWGLWLPGFSDWSLWISRCFAAAALVLGLWVVSGRARLQVVEHAVDYRIAAASLGVLLTVGFVALRGMGLDAQTPADGPPRPWELLPAGLFLLGGFMVLRIARRFRPSVQSYAIALATLPNVICHLELGLLSRTEFDAHYFSAHLERVLALLVLLVAWAYDYQRTRYGMKRAWEELESARQRLDQEVESAREVLEEEIRQRQAVENTDRTLQRAMETMTLGVTVVDLEGRIQYVNSADARLHGFEVHELMGRKASIYGIGDPLEAKDPRPEERRFWERETLNRRKDGSRFPVRLISDWVTDLEGRTIGKVTICEDLTRLTMLERTREEFLSEVSHELKTPLTSIIAALGLVGSAQQTGQSGRARELTDIAVRNSERLLVLIDDLLELQSLKSDAVSFDIEPLDLRAVVEEVMSEVDPWAESCAVRLDLQDLRAGARVLADERRLVQVLTNLLSNAIRHTAANRGEWVRLEAGQQGDRSYVSVTDQGKGIPKEQLGRLFHRFGQEVDSGARLPGSSGLGLSIVDALVAGMDGSIEVETAVGKGSTFRVVLPRAADPEAD